jgi:hypothetical protein
LAKRVKDGEFPPPLRDPNRPTAPSTWEESVAEAAIKKRIAASTTVQPAPRPRVRDEHGRYIDEQPVK